MLRIGVVAALVFLAAAGPAAAQASVPLVDAVPSITVEGVARREVVPDLAVLTLGVLSDQPTADRAASDTARGSQKLVAAARSAGIAEADVQTSDLRLTAVTDQHGTITSFQASNRITLRIHDLGKVGVLVEQMVTQGANTIDGLDFEVADPRPILDQLRAEASRDARAKAELYANASGVKLGRLLRIAPEAAGPMPLARAYKVQAVSAAPAIEAGRQPLESRVQVTWELLP